MKSRSLDRSIAMALLAKVWNTASGLLTLVLLINRLSPEYQGYYYFILSLGALQMLAELGLGVVITNLTNHEMGGMTWGANSKLSGSEMQLSRVASVFRFQERWFRRGGLLLFFVIISFGWVYLAGQRDLTNKNDVFVPIVLFGTGVSVSLMVEGQLAFLLGAKKASLVGGCRLFQAVVSSCVLWLGLVIGFELFSLGLSLLISIVLTEIVILSKSRNSFSFLKRVNRIDSPQGSLKWRHEIWPFQWRLGLSFFGGFLLSQMFTPVILKKYGPIAAGRFGLTWQIVSSINSIAFVWISTRAAGFAGLIAENALEELGSRYRKAAVGSSALMVSALGVAAFGRVFVSPDWLRQRILPTPFFLWLCGLGLLNHAVFVASVFLRSLRTDPLWFVSLLQGAITLGLILVLRSGQFLDAAIAMTVGLCFVTLPAALVLFRKHWSQVFRSIATTPSKNAG
jgi:hypothetical protein